MRLTRGPGATTKEGHARTLPFFTTFAGIRLKQTQVLSQQAKSLAQECFICHLSPERKTRRRTSQTPPLVYGLKDDVTHITIYFSILQWKLLMMRPDQLLGCVFPPIIYEDLGRDGGQLKFPPPEPSSTNHCIHGHSAYLLSKPFISAHATWRRPVPCDGPKLQVSHCPHVTSHPVDGFGGLEWWLTTRKWWIRSGFYTEGFTQLVGKWLKFWGKVMIKPPHSRGGNLLI